MSWLLLAVAIALEVAGTTLMKLSDGFTKWPFAVAMMACYMGSLFLLSLVLKDIEVGIAYAVWSGFGILLITTIGILFFKESLDWLKALFIALILVGVIGLNLISKHP